jgi:hypothetical protein
LQNGFTSVKNLSGGYKLWKASTEERDFAEVLHLSNA